MKNTVTKKQIDNILANSEIRVETVYDKVTVVNCKLPNGFVLTEASGAVDKNNYDKELGKELCMKRITNKLWEFEGYALAKKMHEENAKSGKLARDDLSTEILDKKIEISKDEFIIKAAKAVSDFSDNIMFGIALTPIISNICSEIFDADKADKEDKE